MVPIGQAILCQHELPLDAAKARRNAAGRVQPGYRLLAHIGPDALPEVPHLHVHLFADTPLGPMLAR
nr:HIT domain-containing protein [Sphingobium sp. DEHP117]